MQNGLLANLRNCITAVASAELAIVLSSLQDFNHNAVAADRYLTHGLPFSSKNIYHLLIGQPNHDINARLIRATRVPIKAQVFGWLLFKDCLNSKVTSSTKPSSPTPFASDGWICS